MRKEDRRSRYTKQVIKEALFEAIEDKGSFSAVSVTDICKTAEINRSTFYLHYEDKYALLRELIAAELENDPAMAAKDNPPLCQRLPKNPAMQKVFRDRELTSLIAECILEARSPEVVPSLMEKCHLDEEQAYCLFVFMVNGSLSVSRALDWKHGALWDKVRPVVTDFVSGGEHALETAEGIISPIVSDGSRKTEFS